jgi:hypothetical protein
MLLDCGRSISSLADCELYDLLLRLATVIKTQRRSYTESQFRRLVRDGFSRPLPEGRSAEVEIERIIRGEGVLKGFIRLARQIALDERDKMAGR